MPAYKTTWKILTKHTLLTDAILTLDIIHDK